MKKITYFSSEIKYLAVIGFRCNRPFSWVYVLLQFRLEYQTEPLKVLYTQNVLTKMWFEKTDGEWRKYRVFFSLGLPQKVKVWKT